MTSDGVDRLVVNQLLADLLAGLGVYVDEDDDDEMNEMTHTIADFIDSKVATQAIPSEVITSTHYLPEDES